MNPQPLLDAAIIGGGPAGLNAALVLGRARRSVVVIDEALPRNRVTRESHGFLTRDGAPPGELLRIAREQLEPYPSVRYTKDAVIAAEGADGRFVVTTASGATYRARKLLFAAGRKDLPLDVPGLADVYGKSAFVCPYCDGWELRDRRIVWIGKGAFALHMAMTLSGWTDRITLCLHGADDLPEAHREELRRHGIPFYLSRVRAIESRDGQAERVMLEDGTALACEGIFFAPNLAPGTDLPHSLGCQITENGTVVVADAFGATSVPGVFCAGDAATEMYQVVAAASSGALAAIGINKALLAEDWDAKAPK
ncbi:NAD(P)/FAD-dependent oxidoreductase [Paenibacillus sp.]|uniref:NAD(P)/FAD-dependent oxidoreductase n=1 Tax=Paenibacillus sp. TaxID=58172 RepID=UPI002D3BF863|nr:NAD(P)/FAD-dependent oxidoreductase [Paenibacillus sp.]HZG55556.1 NAD(P)/FAD-dependent oxidoreductase [Paenibacillus sp.]